MEIQNYFHPIFSFFQIFNFPISQLQTQHRIFNIDLQYSIAILIHSNLVKNSHINGFKYDFVDKLVDKWRTFLRHLVQEPVAH